MKISKHKKAFTLIELPAVRKCAFTLIELLVTIAIIILLAVLAIPAFNQYAANSEVSSKAEEIKALLERAYSSGMSPPQGANTVHVWINSDGANGKIVITKADNSSEWIPGTSPNDNPTSTDFSSENVTLPDYMFLKDSVNGVTLPPGQSAVYCEIRSPDKFICNNTVTPNLGLGILTLSSDKAPDKQYKIEIKRSPFRVQVTK